MNVQTLVASLRAVNKEDLNMSSTYMSELMKIVEQSANNQPEGFEEGSDSP